MIHARLRAAAGNVGGIPTDGLVSWYTMDNISGSTLVDEQGTYDGTITGATQVAGVIGQALSFDGTDHVSVADNIIKDGTFSISLWAKSTDTTSSNLYIYSQHQNAAANRLVVLFNAGEIWFFHPTTGVLNGGSFTSAVYYHIQVIAGDGSVVLYVDNVEKASYTGAISVSQLGSLIGAGRGDVGQIQNRLDGDIDQLRIYNRTVTASERAALYNEGA